MYSEMSTKELLERAKTLLKRAEAILISLGHCNSAIGFLRESPLLARAAATYLEQQLSKEFTGE